MSRLSTSAVSTVVGTPVGRSHRSSGDSLIQKVQHRCSVDEWIATGSVGLGRVRLASSLGERSQMTIEINFRKNDTESVLLEASEIEMLIALIPRDNKHDTSVVSRKLQTALDALQARRDKAIEFITSLTDDELKMIEMMRVNKGRTDK